MTSWLPMREAYTRYAEGVPNPIRFDSFRRWVTEGRVWSRKVGRFKEIQANCLDALVRVHAKPLGPRIGDAFLAAKPDDGPLMMVTVREELVEEKDGTVPEGMAWIGDDADWAVFDKIIDTVYELGEEFDKDPNAFTYEDENGRTFRCWFGGPVGVFALDTMADAAEQMVQAVRIATVEWMLDWMESRNVVSSQVGEDGKRQYQRVPGFKEAWDEYQERVDSPGGEAKAD